MLYIHNILNSVWMIDTDYASNYLPLVANFMKGVRLDTERRTVDGEMNDRNSVLVMSAGTDRKILDPASAPKGSIAMIHVNGVITKHDQECGPAGMKTKSELLKQCFASDGIDSVILVIDSGGGEAQAMRLMAETIGMKNKPVGAFIEDNCCSAAYGIASACDFICANSKLAMVGSIGTYGTVIDFREQLKKMGVEITEIYASASTDKNKPYKDAMDGKPEALLAMIDVVNESFLEHISTSRAEALTEDRKVWGTGKVFFADEAMKIGLIDGIDTFENFLNYFNS